MFQDRLATRKRHRRASLLRLLATRDISAREDQDAEDFQSAKAWRVMVGVGICIGSSLPPWHSLPVFIDEKIAADPFLPGLTEATLPITTTAIFVGWVVGSLGLPRAMQVFSTEQLLLVCVVGLVLISFALVTVPYITAGSLAAFTCLRFVQGIFMNITMLQCIYVQDSLPPEWGNRALVCTNVMYCLFDIFMSAICGGPALNADWRIESLLFYAVPMPLGMLIAFPNFMEILKSIPQTGKALFQSTSSRFQPVSTSAVESSLSPSEIHHAIALASAFLACGCSFHGLSYSAGQLSSNRYMSMALLNGADIVGYLGALSAGSWGRGKVQSTAFFLASLSLLLCSTGDPGTPLVLVSAMVGRLFLDACFTLIYLTVVDVFTPSARKTVLPICEVVMRLGGILAPYCGTLPAAVSCQLFGFMCLAAAVGTLQLPDGSQAAAEIAKESDDERLRGSTQKSIEIIST